MKALQQLMEGTGPAVAPLITDDVLDLIYRWLVSVRVCVGVCGCV